MRKSAVCVCVLLRNIQCDRRLIEAKSPPWREREERKRREEEQRRGGKGAVIEVLDKSHKARDHFNREVSAVKLCVGLSVPTLFLNSVWVYRSHLIAYSIPVELAGGELV